MKPTGMKEVEKAKKDGRGERAYDSRGEMVVPVDFIELLSKKQKSV